MIATPSRHTEIQRRQAFTFYIILAGIFIACLVGGNLIFQKFFSWTPFYWLDFGALETSTWHRLTHHTFEISVGIIPYPLTFLITDIISEIYGSKKANLVVFAGLFATLFIFLIVLLADVAPATGYSPVDDAMFSKVFGYTGLALTASMLAYLLAQLIDIRLFHFWKRITKGKMLWVRNNFSTIASQSVDTAAVLLLLCAFGAIPWELFFILFINGFIFKVIIALLDTPLFYLASALARKKFGLKVGEEIEFL